MKSPAIKNNVPAFRISGLNVYLSGQHILEDISFEIPQGSISTIIGPNGSGKSTLIKSILGLIETRTGKVEVLGSRLEHVRNLIGYVPQRFEFDRNFPMTVREFMSLALHEHAASKTIEAKLQEVGLPENVANKQIGQLSGGQLQRVLIAQAIVNDPLILIMDEPSAGVDIVGEATFYDLIRHLNVHHRTTIVMVSHDIAVMSELVNQVICLNKVLLCSGSPKLALSDKTLAEVFGGKAAAYVHLHENNDGRPNHSPHA